jgi:putative glutamine amidotransferase
MRIGITDTFSEDKFEQYVDWILSVDEKIETVKLSNKLDNVSEINKIDGLLLSGGGDLHPRYYEKEYQLKKAKGINEERDEFEFNLIEQALNNDMPILGICRGIQVMNVYLGGSLTVDMVSDGFNDHTSQLDQIFKHSISIVPNSMLYVLTGIPEIEVNSFHHQAVDRLGKGLMCSALSSDGVIEAAEWVLKDNMPFLMLVQWHPERVINDFLSQKLARLFLHEVHRYNLSLRSVS